MMDGRRRRSIKEGFDLAIGFFGFFTAAFCVITLVFEIIRQDALWWAIATLVLGIVTAILWAARQAVLGRMDRAASALEQD